MFCYSDIQPSTWGVWEMEVTSGVQAWSLVEVWDEVMGETIRI